MTFPEYMQEVAEELQRKSQAIRRDFASHKLSGGENREYLVEDFLREHLPKRFGISTGLVITNDGSVSNQADLLIVDQQNNSPFYAKHRNQLWPVEAVYALIEVKSALDKRDLTDAVAKGRNFKKLTRKFYNVDGLQKIDDSLFIIWGFKATSPEIFTKNITEILQEVPSAERPDLIISLDGLVAKAGSYLELVKFGHPTSEYRRELLDRYKGDVSSLMSRIVEVDQMVVKQADDSNQNNALMTWYTYLDSWLRLAGTRFSNPLDYLPPDRIWGSTIG